MSKSNQGPKFNQDDKLNIHKHSDERFKRYSILIKSVIINFDFGNDKAMQIKSLNYKFTKNGKYCIK